MPNSGEVRINGAHVFINDVSVSSLSATPPVVVKRKNMTDPVPKPTPPGRTSPVRGGHTGRKHKKLSRGNAPAFHGVIRAPVKYVHQDGHEHCGRASLAMLRLNDNPHANIYDGGGGSLRPLSPGAVSELLPEYTTINPHGLAAKEEALREVGASINEGHPAMVKTDLYGNEHIFILTGYDPNAGQFTATNTFVSSANGGDPSGMTMMAGVPLDVAHLAQHLKTQGAGPLIFVPPKKGR